MINIVSNSVLGNLTGEYSVYEKFAGCQVMFHVSTLLKFTAGDEQQVERKRYLGNDVVVIIFRDGAEGEEICPIDPSAFHSQFNRTKCEPKFSISL